MATSAEITKILMTLQVAYPNYKPTSVGEMVDLYTRKLARFPIGVLQQAVDQVIDENKFFPAISEVVERASRIRQPVTVDQSVDRLAEQRQALEDKFYSTGELVEDEWMGLYYAFKYAGREFGAEALAKKFGEIQEAESHDREMRGVLAAG